MKERIARQLPPGFPWAKELRVFLIGGGAAFLVQLIAFWSRYESAYRDLFLWYGQGMKMLIPGAVMAPFGALLGREMYLFAILLFCAAAAGVLHHLYYRQGSMSIYLMRRLPDRRLLLRQCWTMPLAEAIFTLAVLAAALGLGYLVYILRTPAGALPAGF